MPRRRLRPTAALAVAVAALLALPAGASALTVYAAASLRDAFPALDSSPTYSFDASNRLQLQIQRGAPADVFAAASPREPQALLRAGRCTRPQTFATNLLVLLVPRSNPGRIRSVADLRAGGKRLAIGAAGVPIGDYTRTLLARMGLTGILDSNTVSNEVNVAGVVSKVALGSADAGFAYATDARSASGRVRAIALPRAAQPPVRYQVCVVRRARADAAGARAFVRRLLSTDGRRTLRRFGFGLPARG